MNHVLALNSALKFDALAKLSVEELKDLAEAGAPAMPIGKSCRRLCRGAVCRNNGAGPVTAEVDSELDESPAHYEVELHTAGRVRVSGRCLHGKGDHGQKDLPSTVSAQNDTVKPSQPVSPPAQSSQPAQPSGSADIDHAKAKIYGPESRRCE